MPEPARTQYEEKYVEAIRLVGSKYLEAGDIPTAWAYYRAIGENASRSRGRSTTTGPTRTTATSGSARSSRSRSTTASHPRRGFELILEHYGTCSAITAFEQLPAQDEAVRVGLRRAA